MPRTVTITDNLNATETMLFGLENETLEYVKNNFIVKKVPGRGRSVFAKRPFIKSEYVLEYKGICQKYSEDDFQNWQHTYETNGELPYCLEFHFQGEKYCIDATREYTYGVARLINHVRNPNLKLFKPLLVEQHGMPRIAMFAACDIKEGDELFWDYFSSGNPTKCLLGTSTKTNIVPKELQWIYSYRKKTGGITYRIPNKKRSSTSGLCLICYKLQKKIACHLIKTHAIHDKLRRMKLIKGGREKKINKSTLQNIKRGRRALQCPFCKKNFLLLPRHLSTVHKLEGEEKRSIVQDSRNSKIYSEIEERKISFQ